jgi:hypothetical protein
MVDVAITLVSTLSAGGFALLATQLSDRRVRRREEQAFRTETALELAGMERYIWVEDLIELRAQIERQRARMTVAGTPIGLIEAFESVTLACWRDRTPVPDSDIVEMGISTRLLAARQLVHRAIREELLDGDAADLAEEALAESHAALVDEL